MSCAKLRVRLANRGNPDFGQDPRRTLPGVPCRAVNVTTLREASNACLAYIAEYELGGGNWTGGEVWRGNTLVAHISYNGRAWPPGQWRSGLEPLDLDGDV